LSQPEAEGGSPEPTYSRAFNNIVQDKDDVVGLLAYALYKRAIREDAMGGKRPPGSERNPSETTVETFRSAAQQILGEIVSASLEGAKAELQISAALDAIDTAESNIQRHVTERTGFMPSLVANVLAWAFTLFITVLIFFALDRPSPEEVIAARAEEALGHTSPPASPAAASPTPTAT
jgi:hypothetical protein